MTRIALVLIYLAGAAMAVVLLNANTGDESLLIAVWAIASLLLGWGTGRPAFALLPFLAIPFSVPFGFPDNYAYSEPPPIWWEATILASVSAGLIVFAVLIKQVVESCRRAPGPNS